MQELRLFSTKPNADSAKYVLQKGDERFMRWRAFVRRGAKTLVFLGLAACAAVLAVNGFIIYQVKNQILTAEKAEGLSDVDCIMVLGCGVRADGSPSMMLKDRLDTGIRLYRAGVSDRLLMSGDHGREDYDEVNLMKSYAVNAGVPSEAVFMDHAGFSTYESMYRARDIFQAKRIVVVTQNYHMYRALYVAQAMGMEAYGVPAQAERYGGQLGRDVRELLARPKDLLYTMVKPKPKYLGEAIPVSGDGNATNDKAE